MAHHKDLTGTDLHEPKGVASATSGQVYVANGSGSGAWSTPKSSYVVVCRSFTDISTAQDMYIAAPVAGVISAIYLVLDSAINTADSTFSSYINGVTIVNGGITVAFTGSAAGTQFSTAPSANNVVVAGDVIKLSTDGASSGVASASVVVVINVS